MARRTAAAGQGHDAPAHAAPLAPPPPPPMDVRRQPRLVWDARRRRYVEHRTFGGWIALIGGWSTAVPLVAAAAWLQVHTGVFIVRMRPDQAPAWEWDPQHAPVTQLAGSLAALLLLAMALVAGTNLRALAYGMSQTLLTLASVVFAVVVQASRAAHRWPRAAAATVACLWLTCLVVLPSSRRAVAVFGGPVAAAATAAAYAVDRWRRRNAPASPPAPVVASREVAIWRVKVAARASTLPDGTRVDDGPLPGCRCADTTEPVYRDGELAGFRLLVHGSSLKQNVETFRSTNIVAAIAAAYQTTAAGVKVIEIGDHQSAVIEVIESRFLEKKRAERRKRIMEASTWPGPLLDVTTGVAAIGVCADDGTPMQWQVWVPGQGARHGWIVGAQGSGKTGGLTGLLASSCSARVIVPHIIDLGRASLPEWQGFTASWATNVPAAVKVLQRLEGLYETRISWMETSKKPVFPDPSEETPLHLVVIEEAPEITGSSEAMRIVLRLVRLARKTGIGVIWVTQYGNADKAFGSAGTVMREQLKAGNIWMFALTGESVGQALAGARDEDADSLFDLSAIAIPKGVTGACVAWTPPHTAGPVLGRSWWITDDRRAQEIPQLIALPDFAAEMAAADAWILAQTAEESAAPEGGEAVEDEEVRGNAARVLAALRGSVKPGAVVTTGWIAALVGDIKPSSLDYALRVLVRQKKLTNVKHGEWSLAA